MRGEFFPTMLTGFLQRVPRNVGFLITSRRTIFVIANVVRFKFFAAVLANKSFDFLIGNATAFWRVSFSMFCWR